MARFVVASLSSVRSIGHELATIVPKLLSVTFYPLIVSGDKENGMFSDLLEYNWVRPIMTYKPNQIGDILEKIIIDQRGDISWRIPLSVLYETMLSWQNKEGKSGYAPVFSPLFLHCML